ncbi:MAG: hypothetical protein LBD29_07060 [Treponema sp.]|jgi:hypothetical protein|nr:hypothetical protein [Treponema sp.]
MEKQLSMAAYQLRMREMPEMSTNKSVACKMQLLSKGIAIDDSVIQNYDQDFIEKRSAYGIQDPSKYLALRVPQELIIMPDELVCAININPKSNTVLKYDIGKREYYVESDTFTCVVTFPKRPLFYSKQLQSDPSTRVNQIISMYGGHCVGAFLVRNCWFEKNGVCHFCSLCNNHGNRNDFYNIINSDVLVESIEIALQEEYPITQIILNGGNLASLNDNFEFYAERITAVRIMLDRNKRTDVELHLIVSPPKDFEKIEALRNLNIKVAMNTEVYDDNLFEKYCPGKSKHIGHGHLFNALRKAVDVVGTENVFSILVGGLEPIDSLTWGISSMIADGIIPVINVLHIDPDTLMNSDQHPSFEYIMEAGRLLQKAYTQLSPTFRPFYLNCGRNSLDTEAYRKLFY